MLTVVLQVLRLHSFNLPELDPNVPVASFVLALLPGRIVRSFGGLVDDGLEVLSIMLHRILL